jgi:hypothetical protein
MEKKFEVGGRYWNAIYPYWGKISIYKGPEVFLRDFHSVPTPIGYLFAVHWCQSEICNGGFAQFFANPTGVLAPEAEMGCNVIGVPICGELISKAMSFFGSPYPRDFDERNLALENCDPKWWKIEYFHDLNSAFYDELNNLYIFCDAYAEKHN